MFTCFNVQNHIVFPLYIVEALPLTLCLKPFVFAPLFKPTLSFHEHLGHITMPLFILLSASASCVKPVE